MVSVDTRQVVHNHHDFFTENFLSNWDGDETVSEIVDVGGLVRTGAERRTVNGNVSTGFFTIETKNVKANLNGNTTVSKGYGLTVFLKSEFDKE